MKECDKVKSIIIFSLMLGMCLLQGCETKKDLFTAKETNTTMQETSEHVQDITNTLSQQTNEVYVYVCGCVYYPGVYSLEVGSRICDALEAAGGVTEAGKPEALNQAECIKDGQTVYVPSVDEMRSLDEEDGLVDINQADKATLMTLPGIGESKADLIIQYRQEHGKFESIDDLMNIPGIKAGVFNKIKDSIKVS